ncbi:UNKNOWN [Stylonychia lemnae]|uniref:Uncharacterized protein n=1 Tax=Stylonychia lemnae TaxID=5949 RepID=A0A077ZQ32_STYLE|nr:UNKNOWN [Stylonychia lemnae]|eukprot:CDW72042.1 UNKNOWN [Stylonychia lemnae]
MLKQMLAKQEAEFGDIKNSKEFKAMAKKFGDDEEDPDIAALNKEMAKYEKFANEDGDDDLDDDQLLAELGGDDDDFDIEQLRVQEQDLIKKVALQKKLALQEKNANNIPKAKQHLMASKKIQEELDTLYIAYPQLKQQEAKASIQQRSEQQVQVNVQAKQGVDTQLKGISPPTNFQAEQKQQQSAAINIPGLNCNFDDDIEVEEQVHDNDKMNAMSVIENEMNIMKKFIANSSGLEKSFYEDKLSTLEFAQSIGILTAEKYLQNIKAFMKSEQALCDQLSKQLKPGNKHLLRVKERIALVENEIKESEEPQEEEQEESKEQFMQVDENKFERKQTLVQMANNVQKQQNQSSGGNKQQEYQQLDYNEKQYLRRETITEDQVDFNRINKEHFDLLTERIEDYREACSFMKDKIGDRKKAIEFLQIAENLANLKETLVSGKKIDTLKIDAPVNPATVLGMDDKTRLKQFNDLIDDLNKRFEEHKEKAHKLVEASKTVKKPDQKEHLKKEAQEQIGQATKLKEQMALLNLKKKNPWQAPPITHYETMYTRKERRNDDIGPLKMRVCFKTTESLKKSGASYVKLYFQLNEKLCLQSKFDISKDHQEEWTIDDKSNLKLIDKKDLNVALKKKKFFGVDELEKKTIKLSGLGTKCDFEKEMKLKNFDFLLSFHLTEPIRQKDFEEIPVKKLIIDSYPEPFRGGHQSQQQQQIQQQKPVPQQQPKPQQQIQKQSVKQQPAQQQQVQQKPAAQFSGALPEGVNQVDVDDPDNITNLTCVSLLEKKLAQQQALMNKCIEDGVRPSQEIKDRLLAITKQKMAKTGKLTGEMYNEYMSRQIAKDAQLLKYFIQSGDVKKANLVRERIKIIQEELNDS